MLGEPARTRYDLHFRVAGIPVRVHPLFWLVGLMLGLRLQPIVLVIWMGVLFVSILIHELGHAVAARYYGKEPRIILLGFGGLCAYDSTRHIPSQQIAISAAGPSAGFLFAALIIAAVVLSGHKTTFGVGPVVWVIGSGDPLVDRRLDWLVYLLLFINITWGIVNLFPVLPLDGGQIARELLIQLDVPSATEVAYMISVVTGGLLAAGALMLGRLYVAILFGYLAYSSYTTLQALRGGGFGSGRGW